MQSLILACLLGLSVSIPQYVYTSSGGTLPGQERSGTRSSGSYKRPPVVDCPTGQAVDGTGTCVEAEIDQKVYFYRGSDIVATPSGPTFVPKPKVYYNIVYVRTPSQPDAPDPIVIPPTQNKYLVYVLTKNGEQEQQVIEIPAGPNQAPGVFYVNYNVGDNPEVGGGLTLQEVLAQQGRQGQVVTSNRANGVRFGGSGGFRGSSGLERSAGFGGIGGFGGSSRLQGNGGRGGNYANGRFTGIGELGQSGRSSEPQTKGGFTFTGGVQGNERYERSGGFRKSELRGGLETIGEVTGSGLQGNGTYGESEGFIGFEENARLQTSEGVIETGGLQGNGIYRSEPLGGFDRMYGIKTSGGATEGAGLQENVIYGGSKVFGDSRGRGEFEVNNGLQESEVLGGSNAYEGIGGPERSAEFEGIAAPHGIPGIVGLEISERTVGSGSFGSEGLQGHVGYEVLAGRGGFQQSIELAGIGRTGGPQVSVGSGRYERSEELNGNGELVDTKVILALEGEDGGSGIATGALEGVTARHGIPGIVGLETSERTVGSGSFGGEELQGHVGYDVLAGRGGFQQSIELAGIGRTGGPQVSVGSGRYERSEELNGNGELVDTKVILALEGEDGGSGIETGALEGVTTGDEHSEVFEIRYGYERNNNQVQ